MKFIGKLIVVVVLLGLLYLGYNIIQNNTTKYNQFEHSIDSLSKEIIKLDSTHLKQDSIIVIYKDSIVILDKTIEIEKTKYIHIKQKYNETRTHITHYTPNQLDSFFTKRYGYLKSDSTIHSR